MPTYYVKLITNDGPTFEKPLKEILGELKVGGAIKVLSPLEYHTSRQRAWYKGPALKGLADWSGETKRAWDQRLKARCGGAKYLKKEVDIVNIEIAGESTPVPITRYTIRGVGKRNMTAYIEDILSEAVKMNWPVSAPDPELRRKT